MICETPREHQPLFKIYTPTWFSDIPISLKVGPAQLYSVHIALTRPRECSNVSPSPPPQSHLTPGSFKSNFITQEVLDKLPQGMSPAQRTQLASSMPKNPKLSSWKATPLQVLLL